MIDYACRALRSVMLGATAVVAGLSSFSLELKRIEKLGAEAYTETDPVAGGIKEANYKEASGSLPGPMDFIKRAYEAAEEEFPIL